MAATHRPELRPANPLQENLCKAIYEAHAPRVYSLCSRMLCDEGAARRVTQAVFTDCFRQLAQGRNFSQIGEALDDLVVRQLRQRLAIFRPFEVVAKTPLLRAEGSSGMEIALRTLPPTERLVFLLHDTHGYSVAVVSRMLGVDGSICRRSLAFARREMYRHLHPTSSSSLVETAEATSNNIAAERRLLMAVVSQALEDAMSSMGQSDLARQARAWLTSESLEPFSFRWICQRLGMSPQQIGVTMAA